MAHDLIVDCIFSYCGTYEFNTNGFRDLEKSINKNRRLLLNIAENFGTVAKKHDVDIKEQYHSGLEHTFIWVAEANSARLIEDLMIESRVAKFNALK